MSLNWDVTDFSTASIFEEAAQWVEGSGRPKADPRWRKDPLGFMTKVLKIDERTIVWSKYPEYANHQWDGTPDPLMAIIEALADNKSVAVESAVGTGKTYLAGGIGPWFLASFEDSLVVTTAPIENQLTLQLWKELGKHWSKFHDEYPSTTTVKLRVRMIEPTSADKESWAIIGYACGVDADSASAVRAQGFHAEHMLIITEETPGIDPAIMTALVGTRTGGHNLQLSQGNPDHQDDALHRFALLPDVVHVRISAYDHPNYVTGREVVPGACTRASVKRLEHYWGGKDTPMYNSRARGISPPQSSQSLIMREWCEKAMDRYEMWVQLPNAKPALGVDVAQSLNGDKAAIARWRGPCLVGVEAFRCTNATELGRNVFVEMKRDGIAPGNVGVDPIGVGAATVNALNELTDYKVQALNSGGKPANAVSRHDKTDDPNRNVYFAAWMPDANGFNNLRTQMWWQMREDLRLGRVALPRDEKLVRQLTSPTYKPKNDKTVLESKDDIKARAAGESPNEADAVVYGNWVRDRDLGMPDTDTSLEWSFAPEVLAVEYEKRRVGKRQPRLTKEEWPEDAVLGGIY